MALDARRIRQDFPALQKTGAIYFDSACTSLKPKAVIDAEAAYYEQAAGCAGRSAHRLAKRTEELFEQARKKVAAFLNADAEGVVFTKNATEALNLAIRSFDYSSRKKIVTTVLEHHSALLPVMEQERRGVAKMELMRTNPDGTFDEEGIADCIDRLTALVVVHHTTNTTGMRAPLEKIVKIAHEAGAAVLVDGAQGVAHSKVDFKRLGADFLAFSGHKMCGPTGIGCLVAKKDALERLDSFIVGGETIESVRIGQVRWKRGAKRFEGGIQNYAGAAGLGAACDYMSRIGMAAVEEHERKLAKRLIEAIGGVKGAVLYGHPSPEKRCALACFNIAGVPHHQVALMSDSLASIALRSGTFCAQPAMESLGAPGGAVRASLYIYNTEEEIETFAETLGRIAKLAR
ncbi:MAG: aminotransferase class V-fold PLP-dependent enzyme [Candidatus Micrarchaeota archaeon]|nr:aminotransferase class V-fold PLP-dependent enzyme [Candidatus Micrarchaeota archaeon]